ncbi:MAG: hypothetical protein AB7Q04_13615 [Steroidobacteraceae bacterium]
MFTYKNQDQLGNALRTPSERPPTETGEAFSLAYDETMRTRNVGALENAIRDEYELVLKDIEERTGKRFANPVYFDSMKYHGPNMGNSSTQVAMINEFLDRNKNEFPGFTPINPEEIKKRAYDKARAAQQDWALASDYNTLSASLAGFAGSLVAGAQDPVNVAVTVGSLLLGPESGGLSFVAREAALNSAVEILSEPYKRTVASELGFKRDVGDFITDVTGAAVFGAGVAGGTIGVKKGFNYLRTLRNTGTPAERTTAIVHERAHETINEDNPSSYASRVAQAESGGNIAAKAATSSATGKYQFIDSTWNDLAKETGVPPIIEGQPDPRLNEAYQETQFKAYTKRSQNALEAAGIAVDDTSLYIAHFLGPRGAVNVLNAINADSRAPITSFIGPGALEANRSVFFKSNGDAKTIQEFYKWAKKKVAPANPTGLPEQHIKNYDQAMKALNEDGPIPEPGIILDKTRPPYVEGLERVDPATVEVDAKTFQFKQGGDELGVTDRLKGVDQWQQDFSGIALVYERADGKRFIADGHQRLALAKRFPDAYLNARVLREADGWTPEMVRRHAALKNIAEGTGTPIDAAKILRSARDANLPPLPPTSALVRQGRALAELADEPFSMVVNGLVPENYGAIVGRIVSDPKFQEAAIRVLNKVKPDNAVQAETIVRQVADTEVTSTKQSTLFGDEVISESLFAERAKVMDASLKALKKDKQVFSTLVNQADRIEGAGNVLSRESNLERMTEDAKVANLVQKLASRKGPISDALTDAARKLKDGARPGDATREFLRAVRESIDDRMERINTPRDSGSLVDNPRSLEPAEIRAEHELLENQPPEKLDQLIADVKEIAEDGRLPKDTTVPVDDMGTKKSLGKIMEELEADKNLVAELTDCVEGTLL